VRELSWFILSPAPTPIIPPIFLPYCFRIAFRRRNCKLKYHPLSAIITILPIYAVTLHTMAPSLNVRIDYELSSHNMYLSHTGHDRIVRISWSNGRMVEWELRYLRTRGGGCCYKSRYRDLLSCFKFSAVFPSLLGTCTSRTPRALPLSCCSINYLIITL
jgi:hypothetical protein